MSEKKYWDDRWTKETGEFKKWFEPKYFDPVMGHVGGHDEARRAWPHRDNDVGAECKFKTMGCSTTAAWNTDRIRQEFKRHLGLKADPAPDELPPSTPNETFLAIKACFDRMSARTTRTERGKALKC